MLIGSTIEAIERELVLQTLARCHGNRTHAARVLGLSVRTMRNKIRQYATDWRRHSRAQLGRRQGSFVGWAKAQLRRARHQALRPRLVGTLALCPPYGSALRLICLPRKRRFCAAVCDKSTRRQITSDFQKSRQALRAKIFRFRICPNQPHNSARLTR